MTDPEIDHILSPEVTAGLSETERRLLAARISFPSDTHARLAARLDLSREHVSRLLRREPLAGVIEGVRSELLGAAIRHIQAASFRAAETLDRALDDEGATLSEKIRAAKALLELCLRVGHGTAIDDDPLQVLADSFTERMIFMAGEYRAGRISPPQCETEQAKPRTTDIPGFSLSASDQGTTPTSVFTTNK